MIFSKNYDNMYYVMVLKVLIKSNYIPTCFIGSHYHHQRSSVYKLKHIIKKLSHYANTHSDFIRTFQIFIKSILLEKLLDT